MYLRFHQELLNMLNEVGPVVNKKVTLDFEKAAMNAIERIHTGATIHNCFFHLTHSFLKRINKIGLKSRYATDRDFNELVKMYMALAFLEAGDIPLAFAELKNNSPMALYPFVQYVADYYVIGKNGNQPRYPPAMWTTYQGDGHHTGTKTQNFVESFHAQIAKILGAKHVGCFRLISELQKEANHQELEIARVMDGQGRPGTKNIYSDRNARISNIVNQKDYYISLFEMLKALSTCIGDETLPRYLDDNDDDTDDSDN